MGIMLFLLGIFIGIPAISGLIGLVKFIVEKLCGFHVTFFRYMMFSWTKSGGYSSIGFSPICELRMNREEKEEFYAVVTFAVEMIIDIIICIIYNILIIGLWKNETIDRRITAFFLGIGLWFAIFIVSYFVFLFKAIKKRSSPLNKKTAEITEQLKNGCTFDEIEVPDHRSFGEKPSDMIVYLVYEFMKKLWDDDVAGTYEVISSMEKAVKVDYINKPMEYLFAWSLVYYNLLYYYSAIKLDKTRAEYFYGMLCEQIHSDKDANAGRVLAAYFLYVKKDARAAKSYAYKAGENVHDFSYRGECLLEDKLIKSLITEIHQAEADLMRNA